MKAQAVEDNYLVLSACLQQVVEFASANPAMDPKPDSAGLALWASQMQQLLVFQQKILLLPGQESRQELEAVSALYSCSQDGLLDLIYASPLPAGAEHWFDYQQEFKARQQQLNALQLLWQWQQAFYTELLLASPHLPLPYPTEGAGNPEDPALAHAGSTDPQPALHW
ncbi:hypothetical protein ACFO3I_14380 [Rheinheimera marina]|uniref:Uncharacterized protein n=1 Tax=Rheinheimera marina TaxID=1774958 RepID=A0ABV9JPK8_9GAMM